jgi:chromosome segregation ATPase
MLKLKMLMLRR